MVCKAERQGISFYGRHGGAVMGAVLYVVGLFFLILFGGFICSILELGNNSYRNRISIDDIYSLDEIFHKTR